MITPEAAIPLTKSQEEMLWDILARAHNEHGSIFGEVRRAINGRVLLCVRVASTEQVKRILEIL